MQLQIYLHKESVSEKTLNITASRTGSVVYRACIIWAYPGFSYESLIGGTPDSGLLTIKYIDRPRSHAPCTYVPIFQPTYDTYV